MNPDSGEHIPLLPIEQSNIHETNIIDWSNSVMYYNIKNGISAFNHDKSEDVYYEFEIEYITSIFKSKEGTDEHV